MGDVVNSNGKKTDRQGAVLRQGVDDPRPWQDIAATIARRHPIELDDELGYLDKPLIIENAFPGWQPRFWGPEDGYIAGPPKHYTKEGDIRFAAVPQTVEDQVEQLVDGVKAGCALSHVHPRDPRDSMAIHEIDHYARIYDKLFEQVDVVSCQHTWEVGPDGRMDFISAGEELLKRGGGNKYIQSAVVLWPPADSYTHGYNDSVTEGMEFFKASKITPVHKIRGSYHLRKLKRVLLDTGVLDSEPHVLVHDMGHPYGWTMDIAPWWPIDMITSLETTRSRIPNSVIGVYSGGRNWLPITIQAILAGADIVRVGIEDCYWMYPHGDEIIQRNIDAINKIVAFAELIGRPLATPEQARKIMGIELTAPTHAGVGAHAGSGA